MEGDPQVQADTVDEAAASSAAPSGESASPAPGQISAASVATMNAMIRGGVLAQDKGSASKPDGDTGDDDGSDTGGESTPMGDVKPSAQPGRRGAAARIAELEAEKVRLQSALDTLQPKPPDPSEEARAVAIEKENRFRRLLLKPQTDNDWEGDDFNFLENEKERRAIHPELQQHYDTILAEDLKAREADFDGRFKGFQDYVLRGMEQSVKGLPGVDFEAVKAAPDFVAREQLIARGSFAAGAAQSEATIKRLREELVEARRDLGGAVRVPIAAGQSGGGRTSDTHAIMNHLIRGGR